MCKFWVCEACKCNESECWSRSTSVRTRKGERCLIRATSGETLVVALSDTDVQIVKNSSAMGAKDESTHLCVSLSSLSLLFASLWRDVLLCVVFVDVVRVKLECEAPCEVMVSEMVMLARQTCELFSEPFLPQPVERDTSCGKSLCVCLRVQERGQTEIIFSSVTFSSLHG